LSDSGDTRSQREDTGILLELYKQKSQEAKDLQGHYIRAFTIYLAITAALFKFALDMSATPALRAAMVFFGVLLSLAGLMVCILGDRLRRSILIDLASLSHALAAPDLASNLLSIKYTVITAIAFVALVLAAWIYLWAT